MRKVASSFFPFLKFEMRPKCYYVIYFCCELDRDDAFCNEVIMFYEEKLLTKAYKMSKL